MAIYTLSKNYIEGVGNNNSHFHNVILKFSNPDCPHKISMDKSQRLFKIYKDLSIHNNDIHTWLDWMTRSSETQFELIDILIGNEICEEELYLMVASATNRDKKIIVGTHQFWKKFQYLDNCSKIKYQDIEVEILDKTEVLNELNPKETNLTIVNNMNTKNNPWQSGLFYIFLALSILATIATICHLVHWTIAPLVIIGSILIIGIIGALQLKNDDKISERNFLELMRETYRRLPLLKNISNKSKE